MLDIKYLRENFIAAEKALASRGGELDLTGFKNLDQQRRALLGEVEQLKAERNQVSGLIGRSQDKSQVQDEIARMKQVSVRVKELDEQLKETESQLQELLLGIPNLPDEQCPVGGGEADNLVFRSWGEKPEFSFAPQAHWDIGTNLGILDFERGGNSPARALPCIWGPELAWSGL